MLGNAPEPEKASFFRKQAIEYQLQRSFNEPAKLVVPYLKGQLVATFFLSLTCIIYIFLSSYRSVSYVKALYPPYNYDVKNEEFKSVQSKSFQESELVKREKSEVEIGFEVNKTFYHNHDIGDEIQIYAVNISDDNSEKINKQLVPESLINVTIVRKNATSSKYRIDVDSDVIEPVKDRGYSQQYILPMFEEEINFSKIIKQASGN